MVSGPLKSSEVEKIHRIGTSAYENQQRVLFRVKSGEAYLPDDLVEDIKRNMSLLSHWGMHP